MSDIMKARKGRRKKNFGTPPPVFVKIWGGGKIFCFDDSCIPKASIYALGGGRPSVYSNGSTGAKPTQVPPLIFMPKVVCFAHNSLYNALKYAISAYMFSK